MSCSDLSSLIVQLELTLQQLGLWQLTPPSDHALASNAPFCCDTMRFEEWLQFVFIPKVRILLTAGQTLRGPMALLPMAEQTWAARDEFSPLFQLLALLDNTVNASR